MVDLPAEFRASALSYYVWSRSPRAGHVLAFALARFIDPKFWWMTIRETPTTASEEEPWIERLLPKDQVIPPLGVSELGQGTQVRRETYDALLRPNGSADDRRALNLYFLLPGRLQQLFDEGHRASGPRAMVCANTNWIRQFYPRNSDSLRPYMEVFPRNGFSIIATSIPPPYEGRYGFDVVLRLDAADPRAWRKARVLVEKSRSIGELRTGVTFTAEELPWYIEAGTAIERATK
jgi:hypothetical protein